ncbi:Na+:solute symporter [Fontisphaera persica]|uniref:sodium:solute symporter family protein n=1 Tax=Fontisphaera persica TaxID=2974023 RepID=UPI0024BF1853|nr:sodium:solute symporter family protein [Fontisphaera persica]WCJ58368.1 Na+:solute symporter [Fontisphaera persica]
MHWLDLVIIVLYFALMVGVGVWVSQKAAQSAESYFLAGKSLPWWIIGIAHGSSGVDITGTMWFVTMLYVYGAKGIWLLWIWPLFNVIFRMVYLGAWVRRSNVLTGAEWMRTRFGKNLGSELAYLSVVLYALVSVVGFLSYAFQGIGKFAKSFLPWPLPAEVYGTLIMVVSGAYCILGGMYSVVLNDLVQFGLILLAAVIIAAVAIAVTSPEQITAAVPAGWEELFFGWRLNLDWSGLVPQLNDKIYGPQGDGYSLYFLFIGMLLFKGILVSMAGPTPNYAIQHVLSTRSPREAALENFMMAIVSLAPRFLLIAGIAVIGLVHFSPELAKMAAAGQKLDFEKILPEVVNQYLPVGAKGLVLAGLLAAFMSTFVSTTNSGVAYIVNDIYKRYLKPDASQQKLVWMGYFWSLMVILAGIGFGFHTGSVQKVTEWVANALVPAFVAPNVLKWHWWRFNGWGFFAGMVSGTAAAVIKLFVPLSPTVTSLVIIGISMIFSVGVCLLTPPEDKAVLKRFYLTVRPWGWWRPIHALCAAEHPRLQANRDAARDWFNIGVGLVWQIAMVAAPIYLVIRNWPRFWACVIVFVATSLVLKFTWYDRLEKEHEMYLTDYEDKPASPTKV